MHRRRILKGFAGLALCLLCVSAARATEGAHWDYEGGAHGPSHWAELDASNRVCSVGSQQSPIAITGSVEADLPSLKVGWKSAVDTIVNNGHTIQVNAAAGGILEVGGENFELLQFHFHHPSEHTIDGKNFAMEAHFVHRHSSGSLGVLGVLLTTGGENAVFSKIISTMPPAAGEPVKAASGIDPNGLLPEQRQYYRYSGSLTTPPCSETVDWMLLAEPVAVADADVAAFARLYPSNARPVQQLDRRFVLHSH